MSGFNVAELMPFYLDETDEHIAALNDALLRLEQDPADAKALQEAFRFFHSIKGSSVIMGFGPVNKLTHHLESLYDQLRCAKRILDRATLDLTFGCLDELRDYHRDLRARGQSEVELSGSIERVIEHLAQAQAPTATVSQAPKSTLAEPAPPAEHGAGGTRSVSATPEPALPVEHGAGGTRRVPATPERVAAAAQPRLEEGAAIAVVVSFQPGLPLADMKARLVLNRLSGKARILSTSPPVEQLEEIEALTRFTVFLTTEADAEELRGLADVEGVEDIRLEAIGGPGESGEAGLARERLERRLERSPPFQRSNQTISPWSQCQARCRWPPRNRATLLPCRRRQSLPVENRRSPKRSASTATGSTT